MSTHRVTLIDVATSAAVVKCIPMQSGDTQFVEISAQTHWGVTQGVWLWEVSNDHRANPVHPDHANAHWDDVTAAFGLTAPTGVAGNDWQDYAPGPVYYMRVTYTPVLPITGALFLAVCLGD